MSFRSAKGNGDYLQIYKAHRSKTTAPRVRRRGFHPVSMSVDST